MVGAVPLTCSLDIWGEMLRPGDSRCRPEGADGESGALSGNAPGSARGEFDFDDQAALRAGAGEDGAIVCGDRGADDGQAQAHAATAVSVAATGSVGAEPAERLEQRRHVLRRDGLAGVADGERGPVRDR